MLTILVRIITTIIITLFKVIVVGTNKPQKTKYDEQRIKKHTQ
jgi:hypothetical protein